MKLKDQAMAEMAKEEAETQGDAGREEKALSAEAEDNETFEGEMDDFQTPLVRCVAGHLHPVPHSFLRNLLIRSARGVFLF